MRLEFEGKRSVDDILNEDIAGNLDLSTLKPDTNKLFSGDNLQVMKCLLKNGYREKFDLIYIDPPFATNTIFRTDSKRNNTISMANDGEIAYQDTLIGDAFLSFIRDRLVIARELLSHKGSIYLHIDYKIGHYVKLVMDEVFGISNFRNDITRIKCNPKNFNRKAYGNIKDLILFYSKTSQPIWNNATIPYTKEEIEKLYKKVDANGRHYTTIPLHAPGETRIGKTSQAFKGILPPKGRHWRSSPEELEELDRLGLIEWSKTNNPRKILYADEKEGKKIQDIWEFKDPQYPSYPTEKNLDLLKQIINISSNKDSLVLDFFCGSGTTLIACEELGRRWVGIDKSPKAIEVVKKRLSKISNLYSPNIEIIKF